MHMLLPYPPIPQRTSLCKWSQVCTEPTDLKASMKNKGSVCLLNPCRCSTTKVLLPRNQQTLRHERAAFFALNNRKHGCLVLTCTG